jgi:fermentation-respiration switch protein FrsA (DUF1100 family)
LTGRRLLAVLAWVAVAMIATIGLLWVFQRSLIYLPTQSVPEPPVDVVEVSYDTEDGLTLTAWLLESEPGRGAVVVFNGNAGNRSHRVPLAWALSDLGFTVLLTDYRGYGGNPGSPSEEGLARDARAALDFMLDRYRDSPLIYFGESLGAGVAIGLATKHPPEAMILRSPFISLPDLAAVHYWWLPSSLLLKDKYLNTQRIATVDAPVLVIAGTEDSIVPPAQSRAVYEAAEEPKELVMVGGAGHNHPELLDGSEMIEGIGEFLDRHLSRQ